MSPPTRDSATRSKILRAAERLFAREGFELLDDVTHELRKEQKEWLTGGYYLFRRGV